MKANDLFKLERKVAVITGGGSGLGRQIAEAYAEMGATIILCARNVDRCQQTAQELSSLGVAAVGWSCDVTQEESVNDLIHRTIAEFGRIDILVNNSGLAWAGAPESLSLTDWKRVIDVNLNGVFLVAQAAGRRMIAQGGGSIVNIASIAGLIATPPEIADTIAYSTSKAAVIHFTRDLAIRWARHGIRVNCIAPGWFSTRMSKRVLETRGSQILPQIPLGRFGGDDDLKGAAVFLGSSASAYLTGQTIVVDGGLSLS